MCQSLEAEIHVKRRFFFYTQGNFGVNLCGMQTLRHTLYISIYTKVFQVIKSNNIKTPNFGYRNNPIWLRNLQPWLWKLPVLAMEKVWLRELAALAMETPSFGYGKS